MSTTTTYYITTANYGTRVAEQANATANYANGILSKVPDLVIIVDKLKNIDDAIANAAAANTLSQTANAVAFLANGTANYANATANIANIVANQANVVVTYLSPIVSNLQLNVENLTTNVLLLQSNVLFLQSNVSNLQTNVWRIEPNVWRIEANLVAFEQLSGNVARLESNVLFLQANVSNLQTNLWRIEPNVWRIEANLVKFEQLSGNVANLESNVNMLWSNVNRLWVNVNTTNVVAVLASNIANQANATANYANSVLTLYYANVVNLPNLYAFSVNANAVAQLANSVAFQANATANLVNVWVTANYSNILKMNDVFQQINLNGLALWSNGQGNIYTYSNVGIGTMSTNDGNVLTVLGNVYISGNLNVNGGLRTTTIPTGTVLVPNNPIYIASPNVGSDFILNLTNPTWDMIGSQYIVDANSIKFSQIGLYTINFNIQATSGGEYDSLIRVNVYTNTNNTLTNATLVKSAVNPATFGPQMQMITVPLNIVNTTNNYIFTCALYRNTYPYTIQTSSFIQLGMMSQLGIPIIPDTQSVIRQMNEKIGIAKEDPSYRLDVNGDINASGSVRINGNPTWDAPSLDYLRYTKSVAIGGYDSPVSGNALSVQGNVNASGYIFTNVYYCSGLPFNYGLNNVYTDQNVLVSKNITVLGNIIGGPWTYLQGSPDLYTSYSNVTVYGNVTANYLVGDLSKAYGIPQDQPWGLIGSNVYTDTSKVVCIGTSTARTGNILTVNGNLSVNNFIYGNIAFSTGLYTPWLQGTNNTYIVSNIGIGTSAVGNTLDVNGNVFLNGNVYVTGKLSAEQVFMIACSDESSSIIPKSNAVTFRVPGRWYLTKFPRISLLSPPTTAGSNVNVFVHVNTSTPILTSNLSIPFNAISSINQSLSWAGTRTLNNDDLVNINITRGDTTATGLKIVFYYMDIY